MLRALRRRPPARVTNLTLLVGLGLVFATGVGAVATGSARGRWIVLGHGAGAALVVVLAPAEAPIVRTALRRHPAARYASLLLAALTIAALVAGVVHSTGLARSVAGLPSLWLHIALALGLGPLLAWHLVVRRGAPGAAAPPPPCPPAPRVARRGRRRHRRRGHPGHGRRRPARFTPPVHRLL